MRHLTWRLSTTLAFGVLLQARVPACAQSTDAGDDYINPDRPAIADGSAVIGAGRFQVETGLQQEYHRGDGSYTRKFYIPTLLRFGTGSNLEVRVEGNAYTNMYAYDPALGATRNEGIAPTSIGVKYQFLEPDGWKRPSAGVILRLFPPSGSGGLGTVHATGDVRLAADWDFAPQWSLNPNIGVALYEDNAQRAYAAGLFAMTLNYKPSPMLSLFVDTGMQSPETKNGGTSVIVDIGVAYVIGRNLQLDVSVGWGVTGATSPDLFLSAGVSRRF